MGFVAHELRTPLTPIMMLLQSLERKAKNGQVDVDAIARARRQTIRLARMIGDLVDLSKIREGQFELDRTSFDISTLLGEVVDSYRPTMPRQRIELYTPGRPLLISADRARLERSLSNLIDHCERLVQAGGTLVIALDERSGTARISIQAGGQAPGSAAQAAGGLPPLETLRPDGSLSQLRGPNLGLCLAQVVARRHGGTVAVEGGPGGPDGIPGVSNLVLTLPLGGDSGPI